MSSRYDNEVRVTLSVLDRLIDYEPEISREPIASRAKNLRQLKQAVKRDLEWLLNTRQTVDGVPPDLEELSNSLATYGLPDFTAIGIENPTDRQRMRRAIEDAVRLFEPRLEDVVVTIEPTRGLERVMHFRIDARLKVDPAPEPVTFDTVLQLASGQYFVQGE